MYPETASALDRNGLLGFTLLEVTIVVVIIGLIAGGILSAEALIRSSKIRAVIGEYDSYLKATQEFQNKYQALPGDMSTATTLWGTDTPCPNTTPLYSAPETGDTCNGNGNGEIAVCDGALESAYCGDEGEVWLAWQHLSNAGFISGRHTGRPGPDPYATTPIVGVNVPASRRSPAGWTLVYLKTVDAAYGHVMVLGDVSYPDRFTNNPALYVSEALEIDTKIDDGQPSTGYILANPFTIVHPFPAAAGNTCTTFSVGEYRTTDDGPDAKCSLIFVTGF